VKPIPKHFHFIFGLKPQKEEFHIAYYLCLKSCLAVNKPDRISFYYHYQPYGEWWDRIEPELELIRVDLEEFIVDNPDYLRHQEGQFIYASNLNYAHQADFIRLRILIEQGGVYADMDTLFVHPLPTELFHNDFVIGTEGDIADKNGVMQRSLCNAFMLSRPAAIFPTQWLENMYKVFNGSWRQHSCIEASKLAKQFPDALTILPKKHFYHHDFSPKGIFTLFEGLDTDFDGVYSMHLWNHLWWESTRIDFSNFHHGLLTENYIQNKNTTFAVAARRFLEHSS
jgi:hypothetical protein